jgi:serine/threonine-protein kinase TTK/MPS1
MLRVIENTLNNTNKTKKKKLLKSQIKQFLYFQNFSNLFVDYSLIYYKYYLFKKNEIIKLKKINEIFKQKKLTDMLRSEFNLKYANKHFKDISNISYLKINKYKKFFQKNYIELHLNINNVDQTNNKMAELVKNLKKKIFFSVSTFRKTFFFCNNKNKIIQMSNLNFSGTYLTAYQESNITFFQNNNIISFDTFELGKKYIQVNGIKYLKLELIGKGGSGKVYKIINNQNKIFALKKTKLASYGIEYLHNCVNEISILKVLKNKFRIIQIQNADISFTKGILYLVFEYGDCDLEYFIKKNLKSFSKIKILKILWKQMLESVYTIHQERIVHGDLKPANFILVNNSLKIIDFGISKPIHKNTTNITRNFQIGTVNYMSPEAVLYIPHIGYSKKKLKISRSSDIWSLGCILYQMVYGQTPFYHLPLMKKIQAIVNKSLEISFLPINVPNLNDVLKNCLRKKASLRPSIPELILHPFLLNLSTVNITLFDLLGKHT